MRIVLPSLLEAPARAALSRFLALIRAPGSGPERRIPRSDPHRGEGRTLPHQASRLPHHPRCNLSQEPAVALALAGCALVSRLDARALVAHSSACRYNQGIANLRSL